LLAAAKDSLSAFRAANESLFDFICFFDRQIGRAGVEFSVGQIELLEKHHPR